jgi:hypothetical protein
VPVECAQLENAPVPLHVCPKCGASPFEPFMRGQVQRAKKTILRKSRHYCALICSICKDIVGHESPPGPGGGFSFCVENPSPKILWDHVIES